MKTDESTPIGAAFAGIIMNEGKAVLTSRGVMTTLDVARLFDEYARSFAVKYAVIGMADCLESREPGEYDHDNSEWTRGVLSATAATIQAVANHQVFKDDLYVLLSTRVRAVDWNNPMSHDEKKTLTADLLEYVGLPADY